MQVIFINQSLLIHFFREPDSLVGGISLKKSGDGYGKDYAVSGIRFKIYIRRVVL